MSRHPAIQMAAVAFNRGGDWWRLLHLPYDDYALAAVVVREAQRLHVEELQAVSDRTAQQTANKLGPMLGQLMKSLAKAMRG